MSADDPQAPAPHPTIFLSYAKEDRAAAQLIRDALPNYGLEAWYDASDLLGGDAWDQKIRQQIRDCDFFMPIISANAEARREGYFRREWRLAAERTLDMTDDTVFLVPVAIDDTPEAHAHVPEKFRAVQWLRLPGGQPNAAFEALCRRLVAGEPEPLAAPPPAGGGRAKRRAARPRREFPPFPREEPGQRVRFWAQVLLWPLESMWIGFQRFPKWTRILVYCWLALVLLNWSAHQAGHPGQPNAAGSLNKLVKSAQLAQALGNGSRGAPIRASLLAIAFTAPPADVRAQKFAAAVFVKMYGHLLRTDHGHVALSTTDLPSLGLPAVLEQGHAYHSNYVLYGGIRGQAPRLTLMVRLIAVANGSVLWRKAYPVAGADPAHIASEALSALPKLASD